MSSVFQCFNIGFQLALILIPDQSPVALHCNTVLLRPALGSVPCWTTPCSAVLPETLIFTFYLPKTMSGNRKMMKQSLSLLCEAKRLLKITIWGKVVLQLHLLCTEREKREWEIERYRQGSRETQWHLHGEEERKIKENKERCEKKMKERVVGAEEESERSVRQIMKKGYLVEK